MSVLDKIKVKAKADVKHVVLPEGEEDLVLGDLDDLPGFDDLGDLGSLDDLDDDF